MSVIRQLSEADALFLAGDSETTYNHTAGLMVLDPSEAKNFSFSAFRRHMAKRISEIPQFSWSLHEVPGGWDRPYWVETDDFDPNRHIRRIAAPSPGDNRAMSEVVSLIFSRHLDRRKPLWELWYIEGLANGRVGVLLKLHHCLMDGEGALRLMAVLLDTEPYPSRAKVKGLIAEHEPGRAPTEMEEYVRTTLNLLRLPGETTRNLLELALPTIRKQFGGRKKKTEAAPLTLHPRLNADVGVERGVACVALPTAKILRVKNHFSVTFNEVVLAVVGGAIRSYLEDRGELPRQSLRTAIPVSLRTEGDDSLGNQVTNVPVTLATNQKDPVKRLKAIRKGSLAAKKQARGGGKPATEIVQAWPPILVGALIQTVTPDQAAQMMGANLIVSNVRGPVDPFYLAGAKLEALYPVSIITPGIACNVTCVSYGKQACIGLTVDPDVLPEYDLITRAMTRELNTLAAAIKKTKK